MKKILRIIIIILLINIPLIVYSEESIPYSEAAKAIKEIMKLYYLKNENIQYSFAKSISQTYNKLGLVPEEITNQDNKYMVCTTFAYDIYNEAFGLDLPHTTSSFMASVSEYYNTNIKGKNIEKDNHLLYYEHKDTGNNDYTQYVYDGNTSFTDFVKIIKPGDIFLHAGGIGHFLVVYDLIKNGNNEVYDALMFNATASLSPKVSSPITHSINRISYNKKITQYNTLNTTNIIERTEIEGAVKTILLSEYAQVTESDFVGGDFVQNGNMKCKDIECAVIRPFYEDENHNSVFNYELKTKQYAKTKIRTEYPGLIIEKTVDKGDNNNVYKNDNLTYSIEIKNKSNITNNGNDAKSYSPFVIEETIGDNVDYVSSNGGTYNEKTKTIKWNISSLEANNTTTLTYTVTVNKLSETPIKATGKFYKSNDSNTYIATGTVENPIVAKQFANNQQPNYETCYNQEYNLGKTGLDLIQGVYECIGGNDIDFTEFNFEKLIEKEDGRKVSDPLKTSDPPVIQLNPLDNNSSEISKIILNNYWGGTVLSSGKTIMIPRYTKNETRAQSINPNDFQEGDILIYRNSSMATKNIVKETSTEEFSIESEPTCKRNIFSLPVDDNGTTESGVTYTTSWDTLTLNGTMTPESESVNSIKIDKSKILFASDLKVGDIFDISIKYLEGSYESSSTKKTSLAPRFISSNDKEIASGTVELPASNNKIVTGSIEITDELKDAKGLIFRIYKSDSHTNPVTFNNYKVRIYVHPTTKSPTCSNPDTKESGIYAYMYYKNKGFSGNSYTGQQNSRNSFDYRYYTNDMPLYTFNNESTIYSNDENAKVFMNYQTLFGKDYYIILRPKIKKYIFNTKTYKLDDDDGIIYGIPANTSLNDVTSKFNTTGIISIKNKQNQNVTNNIATGNIFKALFGIESFEYTVSVKGDVTGTGTINNDDVLQAYKILRKKTSTTKPYEAAADVTNDNNIKINDIAKIYQFVNGKINSLG